MKIDCRLLPGFAPQDVFAELRALAGVEMELELVQHDPVAARARSGDVRRCSRRRCASSTRRRKPVPLLLPGVTDGRFFSRLGIQTYGFLPMQLPEELAFMRLIHAENERLPAAAIEFGTSAIERVLERFS